MGLGGVLGLDFGFVDFGVMDLEMEYLWGLFLMEFCGSGKINVLEQNHHKKHVFSKVDFNGIFKGRNLVILKVRIFRCVVLGC